MTQIELKTDVAIVGGGLAGIVAAIELLDRGQRVLLLDAGERKIFGGLALRAFGGLWLADTPLQRRNRIRDSAELALEDWLRYAEFSTSDIWPRRWAQHYIERCVPDVYHWLKNYGVRFFPAAQWPEKGRFGPGNTIPRYHVLWGTSQFMTKRLINALETHPRRANLELRFQYRVAHLVTRAGAVVGCRGRAEADDRDFEVTASHVVLASGGITGDMDKVREHWPAHWPAAPAVILNGCHPNNDGAMHDAVTDLGGVVTHLDKHWNYAAGVHHPSPHYENEGLSLIPCRSALWTDYRGVRIGPEPLITGFDTRYLCEAVVQQPRPYTWQVMNRKIMLKELAVSGAEHNPSIRDRKLLAFLTDILLGNRWLYREMTEHCADFLVAQSVAELSTKMNALTGTTDVDAPLLEREIRRYDERIARGKPYHNDDQLRRIAQLRSWTGDRVRTCNFQQILAPGAGPLVAVRLHLVTRKTLGGMQTDLDSRVLNAAGAPVAGLFAIGEAAGFGGGGISGLRSLEGHCLPACIMTGQAAARAIANGATGHQPLTVGG